jgi:hypothetical protein
MERDKGKITKACLHSHWTKLLENKHQIAILTRGVAGPDILIKNTNGLIEIKPKDSQFRSAYTHLMECKNEEFAPEKSPYIVVITDKRARVWMRHDDKFASVENPDFVFELPDQETSLVRFLVQEGPDYRLHLEDSISSVLSLIYGGETVCPDVNAAVLCILNAHRPYTVARSNGIIFDAGKEDELAVECSPEAAHFIVERILRRYRVNDQTVVHEHLRHQWSHYQADTKKSSLGKYYTPAHMVIDAKAMIDDFLDANPGCVIADLAAGCGAFLSAFNDRTIIGRDIDAEAVLILKSMGYVNVKVDNSLVKVSRGKLGLTDDDCLVIVGNPPWNDQTSKNKRVGSNGKITVDTEIDPDIATNDFGICFMRAIGKLRPQVVCIIHPLSYLTKEANVRQMKPFLDQYTLNAVKVVSSAEFGKSITSTTPFPVVIARYDLGGGTSWDDLKDFAFHIYGFNDAENRFRHTGEVLTLNKLTTTDHGDRIRKYPPGKSQDKTSDINVYQYNFRDANSVMASANISNKTNGKDYVPVMFAELYKYAYINVFKRHFGKSFVFGNISPLVRDCDLAAEWFRDACQIDMIMNNQGIDAFRRGNLHGAVAKVHGTRCLLNEFRRKASSPNLPEGMPNFYLAFMRFWEHGEDDNRFALKEWFTRYFADLRREFLLPSSPSLRN